jgi:hypothetical protein
MDTSTGSNLSPDETSPRSGGPDPEPETPLVSVLHNKLEIELTGSLQSAPNAHVNNAAFPKPPNALRSVDSGNQAQAQASTSQAKSRRVSWRSSIHINVTKFALHTAQTTKHRPGPVTGNGTSKNRNSTCGSIRVERVSFVARLFHPNTRKRKILVTGSPTLQQLGRSVSTS